MDNFYSQRRIPLNYNLIFGPYDNYKKYIRSFYKKYIMVTTDVSDVENVFHDHNIEILNKVSFTEYNIYLVKMDVAKLKEIIVYDWIVKCKEIK